VDWEYCADALDLIKNLKHQQVQILAIEQTQNAVQLQNAKRAAQAPIALIFGNEVEGVQQQLIDLADSVVEIPQFGTKHSLNVAVSLGIVLWEFTRREFI
jgi:tRNA G18 (ribose-2'-O)-methylase SpoU